MGVTALDHLQEARRGQARLDAGRFARHELRAVALERVALALVLRRDVDGKGHRRRVVDEVVADPFRLPRVPVRNAVHREPPQAAAKDRAPEHLARRPMVRVPIVPVRQRDSARPALPDEPDDIGNLRVGADDAAVGPTQVDAPGGAEHPAGIFSFPLALVGRAVRAQLAARQVAETGAIAARRMDGHGSGQADLDVVGVWAEGEEVYGGDIRQRPTSRLQRWTLGVGLLAAQRAAGMAIARINRDALPTENLSMRCGPPDGALRTLPARPAHSTNYRVMNRLPGVYNAPANRPRARVVSLTTPGPAISILGDDHQN